MNVTFEINESGVVRVRSDDSRSMKINHTSVHVYCAFSLSLSLFQNSFCWCSSDRVFLSRH